MNETNNSDRTPLCYSSEEARTVLDSLSAHIAILDENGVILDTNQAWRDYAVKNGMPEGYDSIGDNYLAVCKAARGEEGTHARVVARGIREVIGRQVDEFLYDYPCHSPDGPTGTTCGPSECPGRDRFGWLSATKRSRPSS